MPRCDIDLQSLSYATDIDVLSNDAVVADAGEYVVVQSPANPNHFWGNFLLYRSPPQVGDRKRWEADFRNHFPAGRASEHMAFGWDVIDGSLGNAQAEFEAAGYELNKVVALVATPGELTLHSRAHAHARVRPLDPDPSSSVDEHAWDAIFRLQMANREPGHSDADYARFLAQRTAERRARFMDGDGAWYVAELDGEVVASCGIVVTNGRARYQAVDTDPAFQRKGLASRLIYDAGCDAIERFGAQRLVIVAEEGYHALPLYESLGFVARERTPGVCWWPRSA